MSFFQYKYQCNWYGGSMRGLGVLCVFMIVMAMSAQSVMADISGIVHGTVHGTVQQDGWQPTASEKLIRMPAKYIDTTVENNFQKSSLANKLRALDAQIHLEVTRMKEFQMMISESDVVSNEQSIEVRHQFLTAKSNYLEMLNEKHQLRESVLGKKAALYQKVIKKLQHSRVRNSDPISIDLIAKQQSARSRLNKTVEQVDTLLASSEQSPFLLAETDLEPLSKNHRSKYQKEYSENLSKVQLLKQAIQKHDANRNPVLGGQSLNREQYLRYLVSNIDSELALLDQERLMLGYMAKLVALDAQALEHEITYNSPDQEAVKIKQQLRVANTADMFIGL